MRGEDSEQLDERLRRAAVNQSLARDANESTRRLRPSSAVMAFVCECWQTTCQEPVTLSLDEYEEVRRTPTRFVVARGHVLTAAEVVVEDTARYQVVQKIGLAGDIAIRLDPRSRDKAAAPHESPAAPGDLEESAAA